MRSSHGVCPSLDLQIICDTRLVGVCLFVGCAPGESRMFCRLKVWDRDPSIRTPDPVFIIIIII